MLTRRAAIASGLASLAAPAWARLGGARFLSSARLASGAHVLIGLTRDGGEAFRAPLPARGHAAAAHPHRPHAVVFARRPGVFALLIDCDTGREIGRVHAKQGRHFYGHGAFSADGLTLFTTENAYETGEGRIGIWNATDGLRRIGEVASGGIGPHDVLRSHDGRSLIVAHGGVRTHPDTGRSKLNLPTMRPNLSWIDITSGEVTGVIEADEHLRKNSLRHLAAAPNGEVLIGAQWQGSPRATPSLLATARQGGSLRWIDGPSQLWRDMRGYVGSVAAGEDGTLFATSPRGGIALRADMGGNLGIERIADVCGAAITSGSAIYTTGNGVVMSGMGTEIAVHEVAFDNHMIEL
ncbi:MAG: DUF1513 domain-containing protein [Pseudomonadota bacterium]